MGVKFTMVESKKRDPFAGTFREPTPELLQVMDSLGREIKRDVENEIKSASGTSSDRSQKSFNASKKYFAKRVKYRVVKKPRKWTVLYISSWGTTNGGVTAFFDRHNIISKAMGKHTKGVL